MRSTRYDKKFVHLHGSNKKGTALSRRPSSLSINPLYGVRGSFTQGELEGAKPASNRIKCRAKPCLARLCVERSDYFRAARRHKNNDIISGCRKSQRLFRQPEETAVRRFLFASISLFCHSKPVRGLARNDRLFRQPERAGFPPPVSYSPAKYASVSATFRSISCRSASKDWNFTSPRSRL